MLKVGIIGYGAIAQFVIRALPSIDAQLSLLLVRAERIASVSQEISPGVRVVDRFENERPDIVVDCAGHQALQQYGEVILSVGVPVLTVSIGALANEDLYDKLTNAARIGNTRLQLSTGAIGGLDALSSARFGALKSVTYTGRKPPQGWIGSRAETVIDLNNLNNKAAIHYSGNARDAALLYPKNANVAAAVALAGAGFEDTQVVLIADPGIQSNTHEITASGDFGKMKFEIQGDTLPGNPRTSALAAMSVVKALGDWRGRVVL